MGKEKKKFISKTQEKDIDKGSEGKIKEKLTEDEKLLIKAITSMGGKATNEEMAKRLGWKVEQVNYVRRNLEERDLIKKTGKKKDRSQIYKIIMPISMFAGLGLSLYQINVLKKNLTTEKQERIAADQYLLSQEQRTLAMLEEFRREQGMEREEFLTYIEQLGTGQIAIRKDLMQTYGITNKNIQDLAMREDLRHAYVQQEFSLVGRDVTDLRMRSALLEARLTHNEYVDLLQNYQLSQHDLQLLVHEGRITNEEMKSIIFDARISGVEGDISDIYSQIDDDDDKKDDGGNGNGGGGGGDGHISDTDWFAQTGTPSSSSPQFSPVTQPTDEEKKKYFWVKTIR